MQEWVRQGIEKHKGKRERCGFCGNILPDDLWDKLDAHFNKESEDLREEINTQISTLEKSITGIREFLKITKSDFYTSLNKEFDLLIESWNETQKKYIENLEILIAELKAREIDVFKERTITDVSDLSDEILKIIQQFNSLINKNNQKTNTLTLDQQKARKELRLSEVAQFLKNIDYSKKNEEINQYEKDVNEFEKDVISKHSEVTALSEKKRVLEAKAKDESKGAELVNDHLSNFFGHDELKLVAEGETPNMKFKIIRESEDAKNLSEGECSLISFCYFIAKMEDEMKDDLNNNKLIIFIDDPISSLDSNHIFFMFSLIESVITKPQKYGQLFIATHNLDFLKYLKRLTVPNGKQNINHFLIERRQKKNKILIIF